MRRSSQSSSLAPRPALSHRVSTNNILMATERVRHIAAHLAPQEPKAPMRVAITGAAGQIGYSLVAMVASGRMLGADQPIILHLLEIPPAEEALKGVTMEIVDCAFPLVKGIIPTVDPKVAFTDVDVALLVGARPRGKGMERKDLLKANAAIFKVQGKALNDYASRNVKVLVVGNPANTNSLIAQSYAPDLPKENFTAMTRLDQHRAQAAIAEKVGVDVDQVRNVIIWGNHSATQFPDVDHGYIVDYPKQHGLTMIRAAVKDDPWLADEFIKKVQQRGAAIIKARGLSSAMSAANAAVEHVRSWILGTGPNEYVSMGIPSDGSYGIEPGIVFSFPCTCQGGRYHIVQGLTWDAFAKEKVRVTEEELREEAAATNE